MVKLVDVHAHVVPSSFPPSPSAAAASRWPCMRCRSTQEATVFMGERPFRELDDRSWSGLRRVEDMDKAGVDVQVLSPMPELLGYWLPEQEGVQLCDHVNGFVGDLVAQNPARFRGLGSVPLQSPGRAADYIARLKPEFGLCGVEIGSNIDGRLLGDPRFDPFYEAAEAHGVAVFVHALHPVVSGAAEVSRDFTQFAGFSLDLGMAAASLLQAGILERFPGLRIGFSHGGGALGAMLGRMDEGWRLSRERDGATTRAPSEQARALFYDNNVYDPAYLRHLATVTAPGQVFCGTDYPYRIMQRDPGGVIDRLELDAATEASMRGGAASRFLCEAL